MPNLHHRPVHPEPPDQRLCVPSLADVVAPSSALLDLPPAGRLRFGDVDLGSGRPAVARSIDGGVRPEPPALWLADRGRPDASDTWSRLVDRFAETNLWPLVLTSLGREYAERPWDAGEFEPAPLTTVDALDPGTVLATGWADSLVPMGADPYVEHLRPFGAEFPGLAPPLPRTGTPAIVTPDALGLWGRGRIGLVACRRPADAIASIGWFGAINSRSAAQVSAVLRSWEDRFGAVLAGLGFATLTLLVPDPPEDESVALPVAAEIAALCPDVLSEDGPVDGFGYASGGTVSGLARLLVDRPVWRLWWD
ncbi:DUF4253 domain-containing protein [Blastococcus tunisiensis]|uniref:DUF4253 domain-containing protein n=1 Tax=Blastococcus tunisiensis TaxID=1798228 RepID=A0A1I2B601_9ACTN|nr:DUF4253 domain-containing protein [Blastococcus sp. DSM 46838]SFE51564.1 protein of unknown function [Blastococcus sp. DSM 46838]